MNAEILSVGTELLLGEILNTDAKFLAEELSSIGINVYYQTVVGDNKERLKSALELALSRSDIVIASGGLGPTPDDLTKEVIAEAMNEELVLDENSLDLIKEYYKATKREMPKSNIKQAMLPENGLILKNNNGTAPGCIIEKNSKTIIMLPGPPNELEPMFRESVRPYLIKKSGNVLYSETLNFFGIGESKLAEMIDDLMKQSNPTVAPYAEIGGVRLRVTAYAESEDEAKKIIIKSKKEIKDRLGEYIYSEGKRTIQETVVELLRERKLTISSAESCTGGLFSKMLVDVAGSSEVMNECIVTYANSAKIKYLDVKSETLDKFGAVSEQTAREMAEGIVKASNADIGIAFTGIAGPGGGTEDKPVGLVYMAIRYNNETCVKKLMLRGNREKIRYLSCLNGFDEVRRIILKK